MIDVLNDLRLFQHIYHQKCLPETARLYRDAADEIERLRLQLVKCRDPETIKKAIDGAFSAKGLRIDWMMRDLIVRGIVTALTDEQGSSK